MKKVFEPADVEIGKHKKFVGSFIWKTLVKERWCSHQIPDSVAVMLLLLLRAK